MAEVLGSAQDSGVETEESNDSVMSNSSVENSNGLQDEPPLLQQPSPESDNGLAEPNHNSAVGSSGGSDSASTPEPSTSGLQMAVPMAAAEDGYLGDCSSDGGNEKNFPMPADLLQRLASTTHAMNELPPEPSKSPENYDDPIDPPAGLNFVHLKQEPQSYGFYEQINENDSRLNNSRKMKSSIKSRFLHNHSGSWSHLKSTIAEKKIRLAASTNNTEGLSRVLESGVVDINVGDEHQRTALHIAAAKGYSEVVRLLLQHGADPNRKDILGNTALHLAACTNHIEVVTLLLRGGTNLETLDNNGRTPLQLAQSKLKLLQRNSNSSGSEMPRVKAEVTQVVDMMREYLLKTGHDYNDLLNSFTHRLTLHQNQDDIHSDLQTLLDSLENLTIKKDG